MSFLALCPNCRRETLAPDDDLGRSVTCHGCAQLFVLVPELVPSVAKPSRWIAPPPTEADESHPAETHKTEAPSEAETQPEVAAFAPANFGPYAATDDELSVPLWGLAGTAAVCGITAGVLAVSSSWMMVIMAVALAGLLLGASATVLFVNRAAAPLEIAFPAVPAFGCFVLLLLALLAPDVLSNRYAVSTPPGQDPNLLRVVPLGGELVPPDQLASPTEPVDAGRFALQKQAIRVRVLGATAGPLQLEGKKPTFTKERYFAIDLAFQHVGAGGEVKLQPWGTTAPRAVPAIRATMGGKAMELATPTGTLTKGRWINEIDLPPGGAATARLIFAEVPWAEPFLLELPAEAWGQPGVFRFRVPKNLLTTGR